MSKVAVTTESEYRYGKKPIEYWENRCLSSLD